MKYTYTLAESAALWIGIDPKEIQKRIDANELKQTELAHEKEISNARKRDAEDLECWRQQEFDCAVCRDVCPDWKTVMTEDGDERQVLNCTTGYRAPFAKIPPEPRTVPAPLAPRSRTTPAPGEFSDMPEFEERLSWLREAAISEDLPVSQENVRSSDLRAWLSRHFPNQRPAFLYPDQAELEVRLEQMTMERDELAAEVESLRALVDTERPLKGKSKSSYLGLIGAFLALLAINHKYKCKDGALRDALCDIFGEAGPPPGLSKSFLEDVFGEAKQHVISSHPELKDAAFPRS
jgi:hypothetical protein